MLTMRRLLLGLISIAAIWGQSLRVPPSSTKGKTPGSFSVLMDSPPGKAPVALQWEFSVPRTLALSAADITTGKAAESAGKSLACAVKPGKDEGVRYTCILAGGTKPISNGPIAVVQYRVQGDLGRATIRVTIENVVGVSLDLKSTAIPGTAANLEVR